jgi:hypothetical protein
MLHERSRRAGGAAACDAEGKTHTLSSSRLRRTLI